MAHHGIGWIERPFVIHQSDSTFLRGGTNGHRDYSFAFATTEQSFCNGPFNRAFSTSWWNDLRNGSHNNGFQGISRSDWPISTISQLRDQSIMLGGITNYQSNRYYISPIGWTAANPQGLNHIGYYQVSDVNQESFRNVTFGTPGHQMNQDPTDWRWRYAQIQVNGINTGQIGSTFNFQYGNPEPQWANMWGTIGTNEDDTINAGFTGQTSQWDGGNLGLATDTMNRRVLSDFSSGRLDRAPGEASDTSSVNLDTTTCTLSGSTMLNKRLGWNSRGMSMSFNSILKAGRDEVHEPRYSSARIFALDAGIAPDDDNWEENMTPKLFGNQWVNGDLTTAHVNLFNFLKNKFANYDPIQED